MEKLLINYIFIVACGFLLLFQPIHTLRIKRADNQANSTAASKLPLPIPLAVDKAQAKISNTTAAAIATAANIGAIKVPLAVPAPVPVAFSPNLQAENKLEESLPLELTDRMQRAKRHMALIDESLLPKAGHRAYHHNGNGGANGNPAPPYVYYNKMISPDGKQELKEFQLLAPNVVIESLQHDMNYGPMPDMGGVLLLNADNNLNGRMHGLVKSKHHHKHKSPSLALPPFLYMLQQMLQPNLNLDMERSRIDTPIYQFLDNAVDNALRNNHEVIEHDNESSDKEKDNYHDSELPSQKIELGKEDKSKESNELMPNRKDDELIVSCPIHHEHHAGNNGETIDDDVVLVNECHIA
ncbi:uncharacterized protein LOC117783672 [Drosophila innubila]|uniref:uncharacterized protein LOC117783672 n=1 Tax=Drosophila innubila TaxID=198719 RepID=UPI00148B50F9|nr:uncharacterized protein LOC117783672 [Drosophila innubila]